MHTHAPASSPHLMSWYSSTAQGSSSLLCLPHMPKKGCCTRYCASGGSAVPAPLPPPPKPHSDMMSSRPLRPTRSARDTWGQQGQQGVRQQVDVCGVVLHCSEAAESASMKQAQQARPCVCKSAPAQACQPPINMSKPPASEPCTARPSSIACTWLQHETLSMPLQQPLTPMRPSSMACTLMPLSRSVTGAPGGSAM